ncbi:MAG: tetratricopeptide repeat protein [Gemmatimonadota bacterium]
MNRITIVALLLTANTGAAQAQTPDTTPRFAAARKAELEAEEAIRKYAEFKPGPPHNGQECDEHIGKWCIYYEPAGQQPPKEPAKVGKAREEAIVALRQAFAVAPARTQTVFPLVRLLVKDDRAAEAVEVASGYLQANESADAHMVLAYALHFARRTEEALQEFNKWLAASPPYLREKIEDIDWLLPPGLGAKYRMSAPRLWRYADALYSTPGNETLADHYGRHAYAQMMAVRPIPSNGEPWTQDEEQLLVRFGPDVVVTRSFVGRQVGVSQTFLGHWDNTAHTYFPPDFDRVIQMRAPVDTLWPTDTLVGRSGHAPPTIRFMRSLQHQAAVFPSGANTLVVAGGTKTDKASAGKPLTGALFLLDADFNVIARSDAVVKNLGDSLVFVGQMPVAANAQFFSAEVYDTVTRFAARARYRLEPPATAGGMTLSGILLTNPFAAGQTPAGRTDASAAPLSRPVVAPKQTLGVYSELAITGAQTRSVNVELEIRSIDKPSAVTRLAGWVGSRLGFAGTSSTPGRLGWTLDLQPHQNTAIALTIDPGKLDGGRYLITLKATDPENGAVVLAEREFLFQPSP